MLKSRGFAAVGSVLVFLLLVPPAVRADVEVDEKAIARAHSFLNSETRGRHIVGYMHAGTKYAGHKYTETRFVTGRDGKRIPGHFALIYPFDWNDDGTTEAAFLCDTLGVSRAGFYACQKRPASTRQQRRDALLVEIRVIHSEV